MRNIDSQNTIMSVKILTSWIMAVNTKVTVCLHTL